MAVTVQQIFDIAIHLMDSQNESTGSTDTADTKEYKLRTVSLLNSVLDRAFPYSDNYRDALEAAGGKRPICPKFSWPRWALVFIQFAGELFHDLPVIRQHIRLTCQPSHLDTGSAAESKGYEEGQEMQAGRQIE